MPGHLAYLQPRDQPPRPAEPTAKPTTEELMQRILQASRRADFYQHNAVVRLHYHRNGYRDQDETPLAVRWRAPHPLNVPA
ncbi:MAG: hypothetical protein ACODAD_02630 [Planctomycetota bacterium]